MLNKTDSSLHLNVKSMKLSIRLCIYHLENERFREISELALNLSTEVASLKFSHSEFLTMISLDVLSYYLIIKNLQIEMKIFVKVLLAVELNIALEKRILSCIQRLEEIVVIKT